MIKTNPHTPHPHIPRLRTCMKAPSSVSVTGSFPSVPRRVASRPASTVSPVGSATARKIRDASAEGYNRKVC